MAKYDDFGGYESSADETTGYESYYDELKELGKLINGNEDKQDESVNAIDDLFDYEGANDDKVEVVGYDNMSQEDKDASVDKVMDIYFKNDKHDGLGIFPITYLSENGIRKEIERCEQQSVEIMEVDSTLVADVQSNAGATLGRFLFPNMFKVVCKGSKNTMHYKFYDEHTMRRTIDFCFRFKGGGLMPGNIRGGLEMIGGNVATNFKPMLAKALYEKYCPDYGTIFDFSCGFGGRMLGALTSKNKYKYRGFEPCTETYTYLTQQAQYIDKYGFNGSESNRCEIVQQGSELELPEHWKGTCDFAFSSPPYFDLEQYSGEDTQCYVQYPDLDSWFEGYVRPTIKNIHTALKDGCNYAVNIADFKLGSNMIEFVDKWLALSEEEGFEPVEVIKMKLQRRVGAGHKDDDGTHKEKKEGIFVFKKT
jgi:hypothetical protein